MLHLLNIEWLKLKKYAAFKVLAIFFIAGVFATNYIVFSVNKNIVSNMDTGRILSFFPYSFENTWQTTSYVTGFLLALPSLLLVMLFTNEYAYKTHRQNIIDGLSRQEFISVKMILGFLFAISSMIIVFLCALVFGLASGTDFSFDGVRHLLYFFLKALTYNMIAVLFSVLIKRTGFAIGVFFIYLGAENLLSYYFIFLSMRLRDKFDVDIGNMGDYLPMNAADGLLAFPKNPVTSMAKTLLPTDITWAVQIFAITYLILFFIWARRKFITADL